MARNLTVEDVQECLTQLFCQRGVPRHLRSDNGPEFTAIQIQKWLNELGASTLFIEPGSPWENGDEESFNGNIRDALFNPKILHTLEETRVLIEGWRKHYNQARPHSTLWNS